MSTLSELREIARSLANVDEVRLPDEELDLFINDAIDDIMTNEDFLFGEAHISTAFTADTQTINPQSADGGIVWMPRSMYYADSNGKRVPVSQITWAEYVQKFGTAATDQDNGSGDPIYFAIYGEDSGGNPTFYLGPIPDSDVSPVYLDARVTFVMVDDDDENALCERAPLAVVYGALMHASPFLELPADDQRPAQWKAKYDEILSRLRTRYGKTRTGAKVARSMQEMS